MTSKRDRYERANMRGGLGVRKRLSEDSLKTTYRLNGVQTGSVVVRAHDKYFGDLTKGFDVGILVRRTAATATIHWAGDEEATIYNQGDARYEADRGRWKFLGPMGPNPLDPDDPVSIALTKLRESIRVSASALADAPAPTKAGKTEETEDMTKMSKAAEERAAAKKQLEQGELKDRETYTAKQVATRLGTDAKTMRKFFRSSNSTVEPVGQGGRYEFAATDLPQIKREFEGWQNKSRARAKPAPQMDTERESRIMQKAIQAVVTGDDPPTSGGRHQFTEDEIEAEVREHFAGMGDDDHEPTAEELEEMARVMELDLDLDLDD